MSGVDITKNSTLRLVHINLGSDFQVETDNTGASDKKPPYTQAGFRPACPTSVRLFFLCDVSRLGVAGVAVVWGEGIILDRGISQNPRAGEPAWQLLLLLLLVPGEPPVLRPSLGAGVRLPVFPGVALRFLVALPCGGTVISGRQWNTQCSVTRRSNTPLGRTLREHNNTTLPDAKCSHYDCLCVSFVQASKG